VTTGRVWRCGGCRKRVSRTAGTIFQDTRTPLTVWFAAGWYMTADPGGVSALTMQKLLGLGSYQTAWTMLHRYRTAMVRPGREVLTGRVEVDETFLGGERPGVRGRGALGKTLVVIAVELREPRGYGRARMSIIPNAEAKTLRKFLITTVEPGSTVVTDGWSAYPKACRDWFAHEPHPVSGSGHEAHELLPAVHRVASLFKRWMLGTHQGRVEVDHLPAYLEEAAAPPVVSTIRRPAVRPGRACFGAYLARAWVGKAGSSARLRGELSGSGAETDPANRHTRSTSPQEDPASGRFSTNDGSPGPTRSCSWALGVLGRIRRIGPSSSR